MLFSGKGKHRRPSKATRAIAIAGVTGAAVAGPLMASGTASAVVAVPAASGSSLIVISARASC